MWQLWQGKIQLVKVLFKEVLNLDVKELLLKIEALEEENVQLRQTIKEMKSDEKLYADEILELKETIKESIRFKNLGGDY